jgi:hypothetical protein
METPADTPTGTPHGPFCPFSAPEPALTVAAHADHRREDFVFARTQSRAMRAARWERRLPPLSRSLLTRAANAAANLMARLA